MVFNPLVSYEDLKGVRKDTLWRVSVDRSTSSIRNFLEVDQGFPSRNDVIADSERWSWMKPVDAKSLEDSVIPALIVNREVQDHVIYYTAMVRNGPNGEIEEQQGIQIAMRNTADNFFHTRAILFPGLFLDFHLGRFFPEKVDFMVKVKKLNFLGKSPELFLVQDFFTLTIVKVRKLNFISANLVGVGGPLEEL